MSSLITPQLVTLDVDLGTSREGVIRALAQKVVDAGRATDVDALYADAWAREQKTDTGIPGGIAIPHCRSTSVLEPTFAMARPNPKVDFGALDGPADLIFLIAAPDGADQAHLKLLSKLARSLIKPDFVNALRSAPTPEAIVELVEGALSDDPAPAASTGAHAAVAGAGSSTAGNDARPSLIAITACPTGIAHTYMAADALAAAAERAGVTMHVETQGSSGAKPLDPSVIAAAGAVIFAVDVDVRDKGRFAGKPVIQSPVKRGIDEPDKMIAEAVAAASNPNARRVAGGGQAQESTADRADEHFGKKLQRWLLTGVSYMIPFVAGGGLLIALGFLLGGYLITENAGTIILQNSLWNLPEGGLATYLGAVAFSVGAASMGFLVPALAGYIAYAIADRPGIAPGFVAGAVAGIIGAGFLGGLVGGLLAGAAAYWLGTLEVPRWLRALMPVVTPGRACSRAPWP